MSEYKPSYDTSIRTTTEVHKQNTTHMDGVDWDYPFFSSEHTSHMCCSDEQKRAEIERLMTWLANCEDALAAGIDCYVSNYGGWPRIWHRVIRVCMASCWPYWKPRPTVLVLGTLGMEDYDWLSLTGFKAEEDAGCREKY